MTTPIHADAERNALVQTKFNQETDEKRKNPTEPERQQHENIEQMLNENEDICNQLDIWQRTKPTPTRHNGSGEAMALLAIILAAINSAATIYYYCRLRSMDKRLREHKDLSAVNTNDEATNNDARN